MGAQFSSNCISQRRYVICKVKDITLCRPKQRTYCCCWPKVWKQLCCCCQCWILAFQFSLYYPFKVHILIRASITVYFCIWSHQTLFSFLSLSVQVIPQCIQLSSSHSNALLLLGVLLLLLTHRHARAPQPPHSPSHTRTCWKKPPPTRAKRKQL